MASTETQSADSKAEEPVCAGLLRDETLFLRQIFGYADTCENQQTLHSSRSVSKLPNSSISDLLLVAIDIDTKEDYAQIIPNQEFHIGISILDTRSLEMSGDSQQSGSGIKSFQFTVGDSRYIRRAADNFLFGNSESTIISELKPWLEQIVSERDVVLVAHGAELDLMALKNLGIDLHAVFVVDTVKAAQYPLGLSYRYSLEKLLEVFGISYPRKKIHAAGNDAHFALRVLLMLVVKDAESQPSTPIITTLIKSLESIALCPRPLSRRELLTPEQEARRYGKPKVKEPKPPGSKKAYWLKRRAKKERRVARRFEREGQAVDIASSPNKSQNETEGDDTESIGWLFEG